MNLKKKTEIESFNKAFYTFLKENYPIILRQLDQKYCTKFNGLDYSDNMRRDVQFKSEWYDENLPIPYLYSWEHYKLFESLLWLCDGPDRNGQGWGSERISDERHVCNAITAGRDSRK